MKKNNPDREQAEEGKRRKKLLFALLLILGLCVAAIVSVTQCRPSASADIGDNWFDASAQTGSYTGKSQEEIIADLNKTVEDGMLNISIAAQIFFSDGSGEGQARIENVDANKKNLRVSITRDDTGEKVYESGGIRPGQFIESISLNQDLPKGQYDATAVFSAYNVETYEQTGQAAAKIKLIVAS
ncbi:MAG: hypothetical protein HGA54_00715 [Actinobacteria bacterium]|nr:hypothetical protein [Actinomycetota bacterium]